MSTGTYHGVKKFTAGEDLSAFRLVALSAGSGSSVVYCDAELVPLGMTEAAVSSGSPVAVRLLNDNGSFKATAAGAFSIGDELYCADDGKVDDDPTSSGGYVFTAFEAATASGDVVSVMPRLLGGAIEGLVYSSVEDSASVENTTTETAFETSKTINGADLAVGDVLEVICRVWVEDQNSTDTLTLKLYLGTEEICTTGAVDVADNDIGFIHAWITIRSLGASGTIIATAETALGVPATVTTTPLRKAQATEDISGTFEIAVKATWSVAHADNECECEQFIVTHHRQ